MITSIFYGLCFLIILTNGDRGIKIMAGLCLAYLLCENSMFYFFSSRPEIFDITLYFTACWALDSILLFTVGCSLKGWKQKLVVAAGIPFMLLQVFAIQYPSLFPDYLYAFAIKNAHMYFIEIFIFTCAYNDNTVKEWVKTVTVLFLVFAAHLV